MINLNRLTQRLSHLCGGNGVKLALLSDSLVAEVDVESFRTPDFSIFFFGEDDHPDNGHDYSLFLASAEIADRLGFCAIWTPERHFTNVGAASPNPAILTAAAATLTSQIKLRAGSVVLPLHHPVQIAEDWAIIDRLSGGRVGVSFAPGWVPNDFIFAPDDYSQRKAILLDKIEQVQALWRGNPQPYRNGIGDIADIAVRPRPHQTEIPVWLTAASSADTFREAGERGANVLTALLQLSTEQLGEHIEIYRHARANAGWDPSTGIVTCMLHTHVCSDLEETLVQCREWLTGYFRSQSDLRRHVATSLGRTAGTDDHRERIIAWSVEQYIREKSLIGTPETCLPMVDKLHALGVDEIACLIDFGGPRDRVLAGLNHLNSLRRLSQNTVARVEASLRAALPVGVPVSVHVTPVSRAGSGPAEAPRKRQLDP